VPDPLKAVGAVLIPIGFFIVWLTFRENSFAALVIKIQKERGQQVVSTGPYGIVRHPMYAGATLYMIGMPLLLGSWLGLLVLPLILAALTVRIFIEEATLHKRLPGIEAGQMRDAWSVLTRINELLGGHRLDADAPFA
jgi:protein-S-isoprenylcysteine O-methyltransferase Ste14